MFLRLYRESAATLDSDRPDLFLHRLIERLGLRRQQVFSAQADVVERLLHLARLGELATSYARRAPQATPRDFARYVAAVAETELRDEDGAPAARRARSRSWRSTPRPGASSTASSYSA